MMQPGTPDNRVCLSASLTHCSQFPLEISSLSRTTIMLPGHTKGAAADHQKQSQKSVTSVTVFVGVM